MTECATLYVTVPTVETAHAIAAQLLEDRLVACANILPGMVSHYRWEGRITQDTEAAMFLKTRKALIERATARIIELHPYDCPCITAWPIEGGNPEYLAWIAAETEG